MSHTQAAFDAVCKDARPAEGWYVTLMQSAPFYGGPEEGGWWGEDSVIAAYQHFPTAEQAEAAAEAVRALAAELEADALRAHGEHCLRELDWLEDRGLDADHLPEPDGPSGFHVLVTEGLPQESRGCRHYE